MASVRMQALELDISLAIMLRWLLLSSVVDPLRQRASLNNCLVSKLGCEKSISLGKRLLLRQSWTISDNTRTT